MSLLRLKRPWGRCSGCRGYLEEIGVAPEVHGVQKLVDLYRRAGGGTTIVRSEEVPPEVRADPYLYRGFVCLGCDRAFCPACSNWQGETCPSCGQRTLLPAYRPLLKMHRSW